MVEKIFPAQDTALPHVLAFVEAELEKVACPMKAVMQITVCMEEMFINIAHYAYVDSSGEMKLEISADNQKVTLTLTDDGIAFDPLAKVDPDITLDADKREIGGLGIFMVKKTMDEVAYERKNGKNIFIMSKQLR